MSHALILLIRADPDACANACFITVACIAYTEIHNTLNQSAPDVNYMSPLRLFCLQQVTFFGKLTLLLGISWRI